MLFHHRSDDGNDLQVPGSKFTFGIVKAAQARGDLDVLVERGPSRHRCETWADEAPRNVHEGAAEVDLRKRSEFN